MQNSFVLPPGYNLVGRVIVAQHGEVLEELIYIEGVHPELHFLGSIEIVAGLNGGNPETKVRVISGLPSDYYTN